MKTRVHCEFYVNSTGIKDIVIINAEGNSVKECLDKAIAEVNQAHPEARGNAWWSAYELISADQVGVLS